MEDGVKYTHSSPATCTTPEPTSSDSGPHPHLTLPTTASGGEEPKRKHPEDQETVRESKRRKICPSALEKCEAFIKSCSNNSNCFSFSFDPKFSSGVSTPEVTPKFGSFNLVADAGISTEIEEKSVEEKKDDVEVKEKGSILEVGGSVDGLSAD